MTKWKNKVVQLLLASVLSCTFSLVQAQIPDDPNDPGLDPDPPRDEIPFDGGVSLVIAAGVAYAAKKGYDKRKKVNQNEQPRD